MDDTADKSKFYDDAKKYWSSIQPNVDGMLGGYAHISSTDIAGSTKFIKEYLKPRGKVNTNRALDCGAGIGRITKRLLLPNFNTVDMAELNQDFLTEAKTKYLGEESKRVANYFCTGLEQFTPEAKGYDVIWCQWVLGQLKDEDFITFFQRCKSGLVDDGMIFVKENVTRGDIAEFDENDSSYCRPRDDLVGLLKQSGLTIIKEEKQKNFPKELFDVRMFALQ